MDNSHAVTRALLRPFFKLEKALPFSPYANPASLAPFGLIPSPHAKRFPLMHLPHVLTLITAYLCLAIFPRLFYTLAARSPKPALAAFFAALHRIGGLYALVHNLVLATVSAHLFFEILSCALAEKYSLYGNPHALYTQERMADAIALFYASKVFEFGDTLIMVMRQSFRQVSFLHVYHHLSIFPVWWLVAIRAPNGEAYFSAMLNSLVHVVMYSYYFLAACGVSRVSAIKKYITSMQMLQFGLMFAQASSIVLSRQLSPAPRRVDGYEPYPAFLSALLWVYMVSMLALFRNFYAKDRAREGVGSKKGTGTVRSDSARPRLNKKKK